MLAAAGAIGLFLAGLLWNANYDYVKRVDAKCLSLESNKAEKTDVERLESRLIRIEDKIDRIRR